MKRKIIIEPLAVESLWYRLTQCGLDNKKVGIWYPETRTHFVPKYDQALEFGEHLLSRLAGARVHKASSTMDGLSNPSQGDSFELSTMVFATLYSVATCQLAQLGNSTASLQVPLTNTTPNFQYCAARQCHPAKRAFKRISPEILHCPALLRECGSEGNRC